MKFQAGLHACMNCGNPTKGKHEFQGVILCSGCKGLVNACIHSCDKQLQQLRTVYVESLRVALASGRLRPTSKISKDSRRKPTIEEFKMFLGKLAEIKDEDDPEMEDEGGEAVEHDEERGGHDDGHFVLRDPSNSIA